VRHLQALLRGGVPAALQWRARAWEHACAWREAVDGVNGRTQGVPTESDGSRDFARGTTGFRWFQTVRTGSIPATSTVIMPLTCNDAVQRSRIPLPLLPGIDVVRMEVGRVHAIDASAQKVIEGFGGPISALGNQH
jgi:hypothetical protein